jgi:hypothetical protein
MELSSVTGGNPANELLQPGPRLTFDYSVFTEKGREDHWRVVKTDGQEQVEKPPRSFPVLAWFSHTDSKNLFFLEIALDGKLVTSRVWPDDRALRLLSRCLILLEPATGLEPVTY